jgi:hypothetical protein
MSGSVPKQGTNQAKKIAGAIGAGESFLLGKSSQLRSKKGRELSKNHAFPDSIELLMRSIKAGEALW